MEFIKENWPFIIIAICILLIASFIGVTFWFFTKSANKSITTAPPTTNAPIITTNPPTTNPPTTNPPTTNPPTTNAPIITTNPPTTSSPIITTNPPTTNAPIITTNPPRTSAPVTTTNVPSEIAKFTGHYKHNDKNGEINMYVIFKDARVFFIGDNLCTINNEENITYGNGKLIRMNKNDEVFGEYDIVGGKLQPTIINADGTKVTENVDVIKVSNEIPQNIKDYVRAFTPAPCAYCVLPSGGNFDDPCYACEADNLRRNVIFGFCDATTLTCVTSSDGRKLDQLTNCSKTFDQLCGNKNMPSCKVDNPCYPCKNKTHWDKKRMKIEEGKYFCTNSGAALEGTVTC